MPLTRILNIGLKDSEITGDKINSASSFTVASLNANTIIASNLYSDTTNSISAYVNASFTLANSVNVLVQEAFNAANNATDTWVRNAANSASSYANGAFNAANNATDTWVRNAANSASSYANSAYSLANTKLSSSGGTLSGDLILTGNLTVQGTQTTIQSETLKLNDNTIDLNSNFETGTPTENAGIRVIRGDETPVQIRWNETLKTWQFTDDGTNYLNVASESAESYANSGYVLANTADQRAVTSGVYANAAYGQANTATTNAATADQRAVTSGVYANAAYGQANTANTLAQAAFDAANSSGSGTSEGSGLFNSAINVAVGYGVTDTLSTAVTFSSNAIVHSIYLTNISNVSTSNIQVTGDFTPSGSSNVSLFYKIPLPYRSSVEILKKPQVIKTNDVLKFQSFNNDVGVSANAYAMIVYETTTSSDYERVGKKINTTYQNMYTSSSNPSVIESIKIVNEDTLYGNHAITLIWTNSSNTLQGYFTKDLILPSNSTIELCETPKYLNAGDKIDAYSTTDDVISILISTKKII